MQEVSATTLLYLQIQQKNISSFLNVLTANLWSLVENLDLKPALSEPIISSRIHLLVEH